MGRRDLATGAVVWAPIVLLFQALVACSSSGECEKDSDCKTGFECKRSVCREIGGITQIPRCDGGPCSQPDTGIARPDAAVDGGPDAETDASEDAGDAEAIDAGDAGDTGMMMGSMDASLAQREGSVLVGQVQTNVTAFDAIAQADLIDRTGATVVYRKASVTNGAAGTCDLIASHVTNAQGVIADSLVATNTNLQTITMLPTMNGHFEAMMTPDPSFFVGPPPIDFQIVSTGQPTSLRDFTYPDLPMRSAPSVMFPGFDSPIQLTGPVMFSWTGGDADPATIELFDATREVVLSCSTASMNGSFVLSSDAINSWFQELPVQPYGVELRFDKDSPVQTVRSESTAPGGLFTMPIVFRTTQAARWEATQ